MFSLNVPEEINTFIWIRWRRKSDFSLFKPMFETEFAHSVNFSPMWSNSAVFWRFTLRFITRFVLNVEKVLRFFFPYFFYLWIPLSKFNIVKKNSLHKYHKKLRKELLFWIFSVFFGFSILNDTVLLLFVISFQKGIQKKSSVIRKYICQFFFGAV